MTPLPAWTEAERAALDAAPVTPNAVRAALAEAALHPSRRLGQNFLIDRNTVAVLLRAAGVAEGDEILEIGPGLGCLTAGLLGAGARVAAIEKDHRLAARLRTAFAPLIDSGRLELVEADALDVDIAGMFAAGPWKWVANLPYVVGGRLLAAAGEWENPPEKIVVTIQKEVADKLVARPGSDAYGLLGVLVSRVYAGRVVHAIPPTCFFPRPEVRSSVAVLERRPEPLCDGAAAGTYRRLARAAFSARRKTIAKALAGELGANPAGTLAAAGIDPAARAEILPPEAFARLACISGANGTA
ncbi:MAG: ribosomal RNA small subunit methyltransferase A [Kiritimatiellae bacterium]|nr:ribosomal RNA small subunit methyltransferase A [Kiritimatiellia bacterium]